MRSTLYILSALCTPIISFHHGFFWGQRSTDIYSSTGWIKRMTDLYLITTRVGHHINKSIA